MNCFIFGASKIKDYSFIKGKIKKEDYIICADGGIYHAEKLGIVPDLIVGDFDSSVKNDKYQNQIVYPKEKDFTDLDLALNYVKEKGFTECIAIGAVGGRTDHTIANINLLKRALDNKINLILLSENEKIMITDSKIKLKKEDYDYVSVFSLSEKSTGVSYKGLKYPLYNETLEFGIPIGISNEVIKSEAEIEVKEGLLLIMQTKNI